MSEIINVTTQLPGKPEYFIIFNCERKPKYGIFSYIDYKKIELDLKEQNASNNIIHCSNWTNTRHVSPDTQAKAFCITCNQWLCDRCFDIHLTKIDCDWKEPFTLKETNTNKENNNINNNPNNLNNNSNSLNNKTNTQSFENTKTKFSFTKENLLCKCHCSESSFWYCDPCQESFCKNCFSHHAEHSLWDTRWILFKNNSNNIDQNLSRFWEHKQEFINRIVNYKAVITADWKQKLNLIDTTFAALYHSCEMFSHWVEHIHSLAKKEPRNDFTSYAKTDLIFFNHHEYDFQNSPLLQDKVENWVKYYHNNFLVQASYKTTLITQRIVRHSIYSLCWYDEYSMALGMSNGTIEIYTRNGKFNLLQTLTGHKQRVTNIIKVRHGRDVDEKTPTLASSGFDWKIILWNYEHGRLLSVWNGHSGPVTVLFQLSSGDWISSGSDTTIKIWDRGVYSRGCVGAHFYTINSIIQISQHLIISGGDDGFLKTWDLKYEHEYLKNSINPNKGTPITAWCLLSDDTFLAGFKTGIIQAYKTSDFNLMFTLTGHNDQITHFSLTHEQHLLTSSKDTTIKLWDLNSKTLFRTVNVHSKTVVQVEEIAKDFIISFSTDKTINIWKIEK